MRIAKRSMVILAVAALSCLAGCTGGREDDAVEPSAAVPASERNDIASLLAEAEGMMRDSDFEGALAACERALRLATEQEDTRDMASSQNALGTIYQALKQRDEALIAYSEAIALSERSKDQARALANRGNLYRETAEYTLALADLHRALQIQEEVFDKEGMCFTLYSIGMTFYETQRLADGLEACQRSLDCCADANDRRKMASSLNCQGLILALLRRPNESIEAFEESLALQEALGSTAYQRAEVLNNMGMTYHNDGQLTPAILMYEDALEMLKLDDWSAARVSRVLGNLALAQHQAGNFATAVSRCEEAIEAARNAADRYAMILPYYVLGLAEISLGNVVEARAHLVSGLDIAEEIGMEGMAGTFRSEIRVLDGL